LVKPRIAIVDNRREEIRQTRRAFDETDAWTDEHRKLLAAANHTLGAADVAGSALPPTRPGVSHRFVPAAARARQLQPIPGPHGNATVAVSSVPTFSIKIAVTS